MSTEHFSDDAFEDVLKNLTAKWGAGFNQRGLAEANYKAIPTGYDDLDSVLTRGANGLFLGGIVEIFGGEGGGKCLTEDTYCLTNNGLMTIREIFEDAGLSCDRKCGFVEKEYEIVNGCNCLETTSHFYKNGASDSNLKTIRIETGFGFSLAGTMHHPIRVMDKNGHVVWKKLEHLVAGDHVCLLRGSGRFGNNSLSDDDGSVVGYLIGDGCYCDPGKLLFSNIDKNIADRFEHSLKECFEECPKVQHYGSGNHQICNVRFASQVREKYGLDLLKSPDKVIPTKIRCAKSTTQASFIRAYFDCDGTYQSEKQNLQFSSASRELIFQLQLMLLNFGIFAHFTSSFNKCYHRDYYELELAGVELDNYRRVIGFNNNAKCNAIMADLDGNPRQRNTNIDVIPNQQANLQSLYDSIDPEQKSRLTWSCFKDVLQGKCELTYGRLRRIIALIDGNIECNQYLLDEMKSLAQNEYLFDNITLIQHRTARTYDFELPKTHSFWSNGFISHNSSVAMRTCGNSQRAGGRCMWIDAESGFSPDLSVINGCDPSKMIMPDLSACRMKKSESGHFLNANEILEMVYQSAMTGAFDLIVVDSVAALMPERILADDADPMKTGVAEVARAMSDMLKKIVAACKAHETTVIFINQIREKPGVMWGNPETTPGGRALGFYASQRIRVEKISGDRGKVVLCDQDGKESLAGHYARTRIVKNKRNAPCPYDIQIPIYYVQYFPDDAKKAYDAARALQVVTIRQGTLTWKDENKVIILQNDGEADFLEQLRQNATLIYRLAAECVAATDDEANQKKKEPFVLSAAIRDLANTYNPVCPPGATEPKKKKGHATGKKAAAIDLDEIDTSA